MASEIKVDTIVNAGGDNDTGIDFATNDQILLKVANATKLTMNSTGQTTIVGEGGTTTTNLQQGLTKSWINHSEGTSINDSFNCTSLTDHNTGYHSHSFVNDHGNKNYAVSGSIIGDSSTATTAYTYSFIGGANSTSNSVHSTSSVKYSLLHYTGNIYDQQMTQVMTVGDLA